MICSLYSGYCAECKELEHYMICTEFEELWENVGSFAICTDCNANLCRGCCRKKCFNGFREYWDFGLCNKAQCAECHRKAKRNGKNNGWFQCAAKIHRSDHLFCKDCHPNNVNYNIHQENHEDNRNFDTECPACCLEIDDYEDFDDDDNNRLGRIILKCTNCKNMAHNTEDNKWFTCKIHRYHNYCADCRPDILDYGIDIEKKKENPCPRCNDVWEVPNQAATSD